MKAAVALMGLVAMAAPPRAAAAQGRMNPATRVVQLLQDLSKKLKADSKVEEDIYETFQCWCKTVKQSKTMSNSAAQSRIDSLRAYIEDVESGKVEFTTERADLELQQKELVVSLEQAKAMRESEQKDYEAAKAEMEAAIKALNQAMGVLKEGTSFVQTSSPKLLTLRWDLRQAISLGKNVLDADEQQFLERVLDGDAEPDKDWKKLNRKATFKAKYQAKSGKIQGLLAKLKATFEENLAEAEKKEEDAVASYSQLTSSKEKMLEHVRTSLIDLTSEGAAKGLTLQESKDEVGDLMDQIEADTKYLKQTAKTCEDTASEYSDRVKLRMEELQALSEAVAVLTSDEARDTVTKAYSRSLLLQTSSGLAVSQRFKTTMTAASAAANDRRPLLLLELAQGATGWEEKVLEQIDKLIKLLKEEANDDLKKKEHCEETIADLTRDAKLKSIDIDEATDAIVKGKAKVEEIVSQIAEQQAQMAETEKSLKSVKSDREAEEMEYKMSVQDDKNAIAILQRARAVLEDFYTKEGFVQVVPPLGRARASAAKAAGLADVISNIDGAQAAKDKEEKATTTRTAKLKVKEAKATTTKAAELKVPKKTALVRTGERPVVEAGMAPPPPPSTWEQPYQVAKGETKGIQTILKLIVADLENDIAKAKASENTAKADFEEQVKQMEKAIEESQKLIQDYNGDKASAESDVQDTVTSRKQAKKTLDTTMEELKNLTPGCDFIAVNFNTRASARDAEIDGLFKAKSILSGDRS